MTCKICFKDFILDNQRKIIEQDSHICNSCLAQLLGKYIIEKIENIKILFLSTYDGLYKQMLMNYKEYGDYELRSCFLYPYLALIKLFSLNYVFVPLPSTKERTDQRGFNHLIEILKFHNLNYVDIFYKTSHDQQKNLDYFSRMKNNDIALNKNIQSIKNRNIILFDDVFTSGSTLFHSLNLIKNLGIKKVKSLIIMKNIRKIY